MGLLFIIMASIIILFLPSLHLSLRKEFHHNGFLQGMLGIIIAVRIKA